MTTSGLKLDTPLHTLSMIVMNACESIAHTVSMCSANKISRNTNTARSYFGHSYPSERGNGETERDLKGVRITILRYISKMSLKLESS